MVHSEEHAAKHARFIMFRQGFKRSVAGRGYLDHEIADLDFRRGWDEGRKAAGDAADAFCKEIGHDYRLDVLR